MTGHMTGHIRALPAAKDGTKRHEVIVAAGRDPVTGKHRQVSRTVRGPLKAAEKVLRGLLTDVDEGRHTGSDASLGQLLDRWMEIKGDRIGRKTAHTWHSYIERRIKPALGHKKVRKLRTDELDTYYQALSRYEHLSPATVRLVHSIIRQALRQAEIWGWVAASPARNVTLPERRQKELEAAAPSDVRRLIETAEANNPDFATFLRLAAATGARRGELCGLRWGDLDVETGVLRISRAIGIVPGSPPYVKDTKTHQVRRVTLDPQTLERLEVHRTSMAGRLVGAKASGGVDPYLFSAASDYSAPWNPDSVSSGFRRLRNQLELQHIRLHDLRHWHASMLADDNTVPIGTTSVRIGHADISTTQRLYVHAVAARDADAAAVIGALLAQRDEAAPGGPGAA